MPIYAIDICLKQFNNMPSFNHSTSSKGFEPTAIDMEFHHQVANKVTNTLTIPEFYVLFYKDLELFYWLSTTEFRTKSSTHSRGISQTPSPNTFAIQFSGVPDNVSSWGIMLLWQVSAISTHLLFPLPSSHTHSIQLFLLH